MLHAPLQLVFIVLCISALLFFIFHNMWFACSQNYLKKRYRSNLFLVNAFVFLRAGTLAMRIQVTFLDLSDDNTKLPSWATEMGTELFIIDLVVLLLYQLLFCLNIGVFWDMLRRSHAAGSSDTFTIRTLILATGTTTALTISLIVLLLEGECEKSSDLLTAYGFLNLVILLSGSHFIFHVVHLLFIDVAYRLTPFDYLYILATGKIHKQSDSNQAEAPQLKGKIVFLTRILFCMLAVQIAHTVRYFIDASELGGMDSTEHELALDNLSQWVEIVLFLLLELPFLFLNLRFLTLTTSEKNVVTRDHEVTKYREAIRIFKSVAVIDEQGAQGGQTSEIHCSDEEEELAVLQVGFEELRAFVEQQGGNAGQQFHVQNSDLVAPLDQRYWREILRSCNSESRKDRLVRRIQRPNSSASLQFEDFMSYLHSPRYNGALDPAHDMVREEEMIHPLADYFVNSSHNSYLTDDQLFGQSSVDAYAQMLSKGARCVELDCWDGKSKPIVKHGWTLTSSILFKDILLAIKECAFLHSDYPIILSLEIHNSEKFQLLMADDLREVLGKLLVTTADFPDALALDGKLPSPQDLRRRIIVKADGPLYSTDTEAAEAVAAASAGATDEEVRLIVEKVKSEKAAEAPEEVAGSPATTARRLSFAGGKNKKEIDSGGIVPELLALTFLCAGDKSQLMKGKFPGQKVKGKDGNDEDETEQQKWVPAQAISISETETASLTQDYQVRTN
jgi:hypothetical protein